MEVDLLVDEWGTTERVALLVLLMIEGAALTTAQIQILAGFQTWEGAYHMMGRISRAIPLYQDDQKRWTILD